MTSFFTHHATTHCITPRTLAAPCSIEGRGLFTGHLPGIKPTRVTILPFESSRRSELPPQFSNIIFHRTDLPDSPPIPAHVAHLAAEPRRTVLSAQPQDPQAPSVQTVEHILSALVGLGITHARIEVLGPEIPILDGSAAGFVDAILRVGTKPLSDTAAITPITVDRVIEIRDETDSTGWTRIVAEPLPSNPHTTPHNFALSLDRTPMRIEYHLRYERSRTGIDLIQNFSFEHGADATDTYTHQVAPARTFCTFAEAKVLRDNGLFTHLTPRDMLVLGPDTQPIDNVLRFADEPARHKALDVLGDLALAGRPIVGHIRAFGTGHGLNHRLARCLAELAKI